MQSEWRKQRIYYESDTSKEWKKRYRDSLFGFLRYQDCNIPGFSPLEENLCLLELAECLPPKSIALEIGSLCGKSTRWLMGGCVLSKSRLFVVDPFDGLFRGDKSPDDPGATINVLPRLLEGNSKAVFNWFMYSAFPTGTMMQDHLTVLRALSQDEARTWHYGKIDLIFIDGDHTRCRQDVEDWLPHLSAHALIIFDDITEGGPALYGIDDPLNTYSTLINQDWRLFGGRGIKRAVTRDPAWWVTRFEATFSDRGGEQESGGHSNLSGRSTNVPTSGGTGRDESTGADIVGTGSSDSFDHAEPVSYDGTTDDPTNAGGGDDGKGVEGRDK